MIKIFKGDSTVFADNKNFITFTINTELNVDGWHAMFTLGSVKKNIQDISSKTFEVILSNYETSTLPLGEMNGILRLTDENGNVKTVSNTIPFLITDEVICNQHESMTIDLTKCEGVSIDVEVGANNVTSINGLTGDVTLTINDLEGKLSYNNLENIPTINGLSITGDVSLEDLRIQPAGDYALIDDIPVNVSQLTNDSKYVDEETLTQKLDEKQDKGDYALKSELPTKVSQLQNDSKYLTSIPSEYITEQELAQKNYVNNTQFTTGLNTKADKVNEIKDLSSTSITLENAIANTIYKYGTLSSLAVNNIPNSVLPITFIFTCASDEVTVNLPSTLESINISNGFEIGKKYVIAIENNIAVLGCIE